MRIVDLREEWDGDLKRAVGTVIWERRDQPPMDLWFATDGPSAEMVQPSPDAFLVAAVQAAAFHFEPRIAVEGEVCPRLVAGVERVLEIMWKWYRDVRPLAIDVDLRSDSEPSAPDAAPAVMFSGGIDSLTTVRLNRLERSPGDSDWIRYGIVLAEGFDAFETDPDGWFWRRLRSMADDAALTLIPMRCNARSLEPAHHFFGNRLLGALLSAQGHALWPHIDHLSIASGGAEGDYQPDGSHQLIDPNYSSGRLEVAFDDRMPDRFDRTRLIADWPAARENLRVCLFSNRLTAGETHCGRCEKCLRTALTLLALERLTDDLPFPPLDLSPAFVDQHLRISPYVAAFYDRIVVELRATGHSELAQVVDRRLAEGRNERRPLGERLRDLERVALHGLVRRTRRRLTA